MIKNFFKENKKIFFIFYLAFLIYWLCFIFSNSLSSAEQSTEQSNKVVELTQKIVSGFDKDAVVDASAVRTSAHFLEFFVLGALLYLGTYFLNSRSHWLLLLSVALSLFIALVDETLQLNSAGRGAEVTDVWVDFLGAICAHAVIIFTITVTRIVKRK